MSATTTNNHLTERDGRRLALEMLRDFERAEEGKDGYSNRALQADLRDPGALQDTEPLRRFLNAYSSAPAAAQEGFLQVLSGLLDDWASDSVTSVDTMEKDALQ